jgi:predicted Fe-Mo cluster-binding NifX family protein
MKIAVSASGKDLKDNVDEKFGRCPYFIVAEIEDKEIKGFEAVANTSIEQKTGAGTTAAQLVADMKTDVIITGNMGPRAFEVFSQLDIEVYGAIGPIEDAIKDFIEGRLKKFDRANGPQNTGTQGGGD